MYRRAKGINLLPYLEDLFFLITGYNACILLTRIVEEDMHLAGLTMNWDKSDNTPLNERLLLGFVVNLTERLFKVTLAR